MSTLAILLALAASVAWAFAMVLAKEGLRWMDLVSYSAVRPFLGLVFIIPYGLLTTGFRNPGLDLVGIAILGGFLDSFVGSLLFLLAVSRSPAHKASTLSLTAPFWGVVTAVLILGEKPQVFVFFAAILVVVGAFFLAGQRGVTRASESSFLGTFLALAAALAWGVAEIVPTKYCLTHGMTPVTYQLIAVATAGVSWGLVALAYKGLNRPLRTSRRGLGIALITAFTSFYLGWILWLSSLTLAPASLLAPVHGSMTFFAFLFSVLFLREHPSARSAIGAVLVSGGVFLVLIMG